MNIQCKRIACIISLCTIIFSIDACAWSIGEAQGENAGWALDDSGRKFFAIGLWGIPGYTFTRSGIPEPPGNAELFATAFPPFNLMVIQTAFEKSYMFRPDVMLMSGLTEIRWHLSTVGYTGPVPLAPDDHPVSGFDISYGRMQSIVGQLNKLRPYLRSSVYEPLTSVFPDSCGVIHFLADEPDRGRSGWYWSPELVETCRDIVREVSPRQLTYIDFGGTVSASRFFYEDLFGPGLVSGTNPELGQCDTGNMATFDYSFDGEHLFEYRKGLFGRGTWVERPASAFTHAFYGNINRISLAYREASDIAGVNAYRVFYEYPETAGEMVDAIRAGGGSGKPVWHFYDAAALAKPRGMSYEEYAALVKCQVYTAIIHGSTGVLFYAVDPDPVAERIYWPLMASLAGELADRRDIFTLPETGHGWDTGYHQSGYNHIHYSVRTASDGTSHLIAANTDPHSSHTVLVEGFPPIELGPFEVTIL